MDALRDPFSRVHPLFWPILWISLRALARWTHKMIEAGHGFAGVAVEVTWYGQIRVRAVDLSLARAAFHSRLLGAPATGPLARLNAAADRMAKRLLSAGAATGETPIALSQVQRTALPAKMLSPCRNRCLTAPPLPLAPGPLSSGQGATRTIWNNPCPAPRGRSCCALHRFPASCDSAALALVAARPI
ncbi:MAG: hypothetical protein AAF753_04430 [Pseudomonadota bacterium]